MHRIDTPTVAPDLFGPGKDGYLQLDPNDPAATQLDDRTFNAIQEELCALVEGTEQDLQDIIIADELTFRQAYLGLVKMWITWMSVAGEDAFILGANLAYAIGGGSLTANASPFDIVVDGRRLNITAAMLTKMGEADHTFGATTDTWVSIDPIGTLPALNFAEVPVNDPDPGPPAGYTTIVRVRTDATEVTDVVDVIEDVVRLSKRFFFKRGLAAESTATSPAIVAEAQSGQTFPMFVRAFAGSVGSPIVAIASNNDACISATSVADAGIDATGKPGVMGTGINSDDHGVHGLSHFSGDPGAAGVRGEGRGDSDGALVSAVEGYPLRVVGAVKDPTSATDGGIWFRSDLDQLGVRRAGLDHYARTSRGGYVFASSGTNLTATSVGTTYDALRIASTAASLSPAKAGTTVSFTFSLQWTTAGFNSDLDIRVLDTTNGNVVVFSHTANFNGTNGFQGTIRVDETYVVPAAGVLTLELEARTNIGSVVVRLSSIRIEGAY